MHLSNLDKTGVEKSEFRLNPKAHRLNSTRRKLDQDVVLIYLKTWYYVKENEKYEPYLSTLSFILF